MAETTPERQPAAEADRLLNRGHLGWLLAQMLPVQLEHVDGDYESAFVDDTDPVYSIAIVAAEMIRHNQHATPGEVITTIGSNWGDDAAAEARQTMRELGDAWKAQDEVRRIRARETARAIVAAQDGAANTADLDAEYLDAADLDTLPTPEPLIEGVLNRHSNVLLIGRDSTYKTFAALGWGLAVACGVTWLGRPTEQTNVLYIAGEGAYGLASRVKAWCYAWHATPERGAFTIRRSAVNLYTGGPDLEHLVEVVEAGSYGLVVVDTLRRASGGADGNSSDMGVVVDNIERIKRATADGSVITIAHTNKADADARGFSGIEDDADIVWHAKTGEAGEVDLTLTKMKDGPDGTVIALATKRVLDSIVLESRYAAGSAVSAQMHESDRKVMAAMTEVFGGTSATITELMEITELPRGTVHRALARLERESRLRRFKRGTVTIVQLPAENDASHPASHFVDQGETP